MSREAGNPANLYDEREVMEEFISCYHHFPALWDSNSPDYLLKNKKDPGYTELLGILQRINSEACLQDVKRKINSLRCCYRREIKKINASANSYKPRLWWFHRMDFLKPVLNIPSPSRIKPDDSFDESSISPNQMTIAFWREFFQLYRSMPELWLVRSDSYRNRRLKDESYNRLLTLLRQFDHCANIHTLKRKINNFRTSYRRELRKVLASPPTYVPALWYFKDLEFLCELESGDLHYDRKEYGFSAEPEMELQLEPQPEPEPLSLQYQSSDQAGLDRNPSGSMMGFSEITEISSSSSDLVQHHHQVVVHHIGSDTEDDDLFAVSFPKEEDALGDIERLSDGEPAHESYLESESEPDPNPEPELVGIPLTVDPKLNQNSLLLAKIEPISHRNNSVSQSRDIDNSAGTTRNNQRRRKSSDSDYNERKAEKRKRTNKESSSDKNRKRDMDRDSDNECDLIGKRMAAHFRHMRPDQRLFAERIISEVLVFGRMDRLTFDTQFNPNNKVG